MSLNMEEIMEKLQTLEKIKMQNRTRARKFYYLHRDKILKEQREKHLTKNNNSFDCVCGGKYKLRFKKVHCKTKKHLSFLESRGT